MQGSKARLASRPIAEQVWRMRRLLPGEGIGLGPYVVGLQTSRVSSTILSSLMVLSLAHRRRRVGGINMAGV